MGSDTAHTNAVLAPNGTTSLPTTTRVTSNAIPAGGTTAKEVHREGSCFQPSRDDTAPGIDTCSQGHGRPTTRGWGDGGQSVSCPRGMQGKESAQPLTQEGNLPSGSTPRVPPPVAPEGTQTQHGGQPRSTLCDPMRLAAKFHSSGWKKDLDHVLWVYYKFNVASFKEAEWVKLKENTSSHIRRKP